MQNDIDKLAAAALLGGLAERDPLVAGAGNVDQHVSVAAPGAQEVGAVSVDLGLHGPEHDLKPAVSALPHGVPPARDDYVRAAKMIALAYGRHDDAPAYLPRTEEDAARFEPHAWVVLAMIQAYADGRASADGRIAAVPELLACLRDLVGQITAFSEQYGEADFETGRATRLLTQLGAELVRPADELAEPDTQRHAAVDHAQELLEALQMLLAIHDNPAGFAGKYGRELDAAIAAQQVKVDKAVNAARSAIAKARRW